MHKHQKFSFADGERYLLFLDNKEVAGRHGKFILGVRELNETQAQAFTKDPGARAAEIRDPACFTSAFRLRVYQLSCLYEDTSTSTLSDEGLRVCTSHLQNAAQNATLSWDSPYFLSSQKI